MIKSKRKLFYFWASMLSLLGVVSSCIYYLGINLFESRIKELVTFIALILILSTMFILFFNIWSIFQSNEVAEKFKKFSNCKYCGESNVRIICHSCDSILWYKLDFFPAIAVFFAHRRWQFMVGFFSLLFIGPITLSYGMILEKTERLNEFEVTSRSTIDFINMSRNMIMEIELIDSDTCDKKYNIELISELQDHYMKFSWLAPEVLGFLNNQKCGKTIAFSRNKDKCSCCQVGNRRSDCTDCNSQECACLILSEQKDEIDYLDKVFLDYISSYHKYHRGSLSLTEKQKIARKFYITGRKIACVISSLSSDISVEIENETFVNYSCADVFEDYPPILDKDSAYIKSQFLSDSIWIPRPCINSPNTAAASTRADR